MNMTTGAKRPQTAQTDPRLRGTFTAKSRTKKGKHVMKTEKTMSFMDTVKAYNADPTSEKALSTLATATVYSVLKKVINTTANPTLKMVRTDMTRGLNDLDRLDYATNNATRLTYSADGDPTVEVIDSALSEAAAKIIHENLGDGLDLVNDAVVAILEETAKQLDRDPDMPTDLERPYTVRRLKKKVWIKVEESVNGWETVETTPIREIYKAVRRAIDASRAMQTDPRNGYTYLEDLAIDSDSAETATIYRRLPKYADMGGRVCDFNGKEIVATSASAVDVEEIDRLVASMNLTTRESTILTYKMRGYGNKAIATAIGVTEDSCKGATNRIRSKARAVGLTPEK